MQSSSPVALWNEHILPLRKELKNSIQTKKTPIGSFVATTLVQLTLIQRVIL